MVISNSHFLKINKKYDALYRKYELKGTNHFGLSINHKDFLGKIEGLCAGLSMFWLFCMARESNPALSFGIRHFYTKITPKNKEQFLPLEGITRRNFKEISRYTNRKYIEKTSKLYKQKRVKLRNSLIEYQKINNFIFKTNICGVCSLDDHNKGSDFKEFFNVIRSPLKMFHTSFS